jgi:hypothetical protein
MASRSKLTIEALTKLGARKLAELLLAEAHRNRQLKQILDLEISANEGPEALHASVRKRLITLANSSSMLAHEKGRELIAELDALRTTIAETLGAQHPQLALDLLWQFLDLHPTILERVDDSSGRVGEVFRTACEDLGPVAEAARADPQDLAATTFAKVTNNGYGIYDGLIVSLNKPLGKKGRVNLRALLLQRRQEYLSADKRAAIDAGRFDYTLSGLSLALRDIADCEGDADAFIDTYRGRDLSNPRFVSEIALRLLRAGRAEDALSYLDRAAPSAENRHFGQAEWRDARIATLDALQRADEAQDLRIAVFQDQLSPTHLRTYLKRLPDFEDVEAEAQALDFVSGHSDAHAALSFLVQWPAHERAAQLILSRIKEIDGDRYELLDPAASALEGKYPLASVLLRRALIEFTLQKARATRYKHAARHVREMDSLNAQIKDYEDYETHDEFVTRLQRSHPRKTSFWSLLPD